MSAKQHSAAADRRRARAERAAEHAGARRTAKLERLRNAQQTLRQRIETAGSDEREKLEKRLSALIEKEERLQIGAYYYRRRQQEAAEAHRREKAEENRQKKLAEIDRRLAQTTDGKAAERLRARRHRVEAGRLGLRREKAAAVEAQLAVLQQNIAEQECRIHHEKTVGDAEPRELARLEKRLSRLQSRERRMKDRIHSLQQAHFITISRRKSMVGLAFVLPWLIGFAVLFVYPLVKTLQLSVGEIVDIERYTIEFTGFSNFARILFEETDVLAMLLDVLKSSFINMIFITVFAFYIATLLNRKIRFRGAFRVVCFLPVMLGTGFVMQQLLAQNVAQSSMQAVMDFLLPKEILMYIGPKVANAVVFFLNQLTVILWHAGVQILIFLSGLQSISTSLYEAARVDGATEWENLWFITIPMMTPMILLNLVYTVVDTFNDSSNEIISYMQQYAFEYNQFSYAAAMCVFFMIFALLLVGAIFAIMHPFTKNVKS